VEIADARDYEIGVAKDGLTRAEPVTWSLNRALYGDLTVWPYAFIDLKLGSHREIRDGFNYKVAARGVALEDDCEVEARNRMTTNIRATALSIFALGAAGLAAEAEPPREARLVLYSAAWAGLAGAVYNVFRTGTRVGEIKRCVERRTFH
jgi:hypothetical protein